MQPSHQRMHQGPLLLPLLGRQSCACLRSHVTCHTSSVRGHMSHIKCHTQSCACLHLVRLRHRLALKVGCCGWGEQRCDLRPEGFWAATPAGWRWRTRRQCPIPPCAAARNERGFQLVLKQEGRGSGGRGGSTWMSWLRRSSSVIHEKMWSLVSNLLGV